MTRYRQIALNQMATLGPLGHLQPAPGTIGSVFAIATGYLIASYNTGALVVAILIVTIIGVFAADSYGRSTGKKDASEVIIDELAGQWIPLVIIPLDATWYAAAFLLFRFFDISKLGPVGQAEKLSGGVGVMADDIVAGILTALTLWLGAGIMEYGL
jgi:phosphatidylglycerophosphatase A